MNVDKNIIKEKIEELKRNGTAVVFECGDYYVQIAAHSPGELYVEAVSHHYHSSINIGLESSFAAMGFHLEEGGNYSRVYPAGATSETDMLADDIVKIFSDLYLAGSSNEPFVVNDIT